MEKLFLELLTIFTTNFPFNQNRKNPPKRRVSYTTPFIPPPSRRRRAPWRTIAFAEHPEQTGNDSLQKQ